MNRGTGRKYEFIFFPGLAKNNHTTGNPANANSVSAKSLLTVTKEADFLGFDPIFGSHFLSVNLNLVNQLQQLLISVG